MDPMTTTGWPHILHFVIVISVARHVACHRGMKVRYTDLRLVKPFPAEHHARRFAYASPDSICFEVVIATGMPTYVKLITGFYYVWAHESGCP